MDISHLDYLTMLARPDTSTEEITVLSQNVLTLIENQYRILEVIFDLIGYMDVKE